MCLINVTSWRLSPKLPATGLLPQPVNISAGPMLVRRECRVAYAISASSIHVASIPLRRPSDLTTRWTWRPPSRAFSLDSHPQDDVHVSGRDGHARQGIGDSFTAGHPSLRFSETGCSSRFCTECRD